MQRPLVRSSGWTVPLLLSVVVLAVAAVPATAIPPDGCYPSNHISFVPPQNTLSAVFYFPWHTPQIEECTASLCSTQASALQNAWCCCVSLPKPQNPVPEEGFYSSDDGGVTQRHMAALAAHEIDVVAAAYTGQNYVTQNLIQRVFPAAEAHGLKVALLYDLAIRFNNNINFDNQTTRDAFVNDMGSFATTTYFKRDSYLKLNNEPVIYLYVTRAIKGTVRPECGNKNCIQYAFELMRSRLADNGVQGVYIVADHLFWTGVNAEFWDKIRFIGAKAVSSFGPVDTQQGVPQGSAGGPVTQWADKMAGLYSDARDPLADRKMQVDIMPGVFVQYDDTGHGAGEVCDAPVPGIPSPASQKYHLRNGEDWTYMLKKAGMDQRWQAKKLSIQNTCNTTETQNTTSIVWIYSFNEWGEGTGLEPLEQRTPAYPYGFESDPLLRTKNVFNASGPTAEPPPPTLRYPIDVTPDLHPVFEWDGVQYGLQYRIVIEDANGNEIANVLKNNPGYQPQNDFAEGSYRWRVRARNAVGWGPPEEKQFTVTTPCPQAAPPAPVVNGPSGCVGSVRPTFSWTPSTCADDYQIALFQVNPELLISGAITPDTSLTLDQDLLPGVQYRWRVKANRSPFFAWSDMTYFTPICGPAISIGDTTVVEGHAGTVDAQLAVTLSAPSASAVTVSYSTANATATLPGDYQSSTGTVTFTPGATSTNLVVRALGDVLDEPVETFAVNLSNAVGGGISDGQGLVSITDDDSPWKVAAVADFNADGEPDLLWQHQSEGWLVVWALNGTVRTETLFPVPNRALDDFVNWKVVGAEDFNGDGDPDLLWRHAGTGGLVVWLMDGVNKVTAQVPQPSAPSADALNWRVVGTADLNGDTHPDLLWQHGPTGNLIVWYMNGLVRTGTATPTPSAPSSDVTNWDVVAIADMNDDTKLDFVWQHRPTGSLVVWHMNGVVRTSVSIPTPSAPSSEGPNWRVVAATNFDAAKPPDLLWQHRGPGSLVVWLMSGVTRTGVAIPVPNAPSE
jgi:hypothetical protein